MDSFIDTQRAQCAYQAYGRTTNFKNFMGGPMPEWEALTDTIQTAWVNAAKAASEFGNGTK